jgi:16S rRNA (adenine1518-N6/adenine1519-N6)-dimethyltransferase
VNHKPRKRFGQNFLIDEDVVAKIIAAIMPAPNDRMLEIGPGPGALTRTLLPAVAELHAVEIDRDLAAALQSRLPKLVLHCCDILQFNVAALGSGVRVVGNLPYNISTPLLFRLGEFVAHIRDIHVMLQREVVERMVAAPSDANYGRLSVMLQYRFAMEQLFIVAPGAFRPVPAVESAFVRLVPLPAPVLAAVDESLFSRVVAAAFSQRRKTLRNSLRNYLAAADFSALTIDAQARAQDLPVRDFVAIANHIAANEGATAH